MAFRAGFTVCKFHHLLTQNSQFPSGVERPVHVRGHTLVHAVIFRSQIVYIQHIVGHGDSVFVLIVNRVVVKKLAVFHPGVLWLRVTRRLTTPSQVTPYICKLVLQFNAKCGTCCKDSMMSVYCHTIPGLHEIIIIMRPS